MHILEEGAGRELLDGRRRSTSDVEVCHEWEVYASGAPSLARLEMLKAALLHQRSSRNASGHGLD